MIVSLSRNRIRSGSHGSITVWCRLNKPKVYLVVIVSLSRNRIRSGSHAPSPFPHTTCGELGKVKVKCAIPHEECCPDLGREPVGG